MIPKLQQLLSLISDSELKSRYRRDFIRSVGGLSRTYDFALITAWKLFILFIYERLWQIPEEEIKKAFKNNNDVIKHYRTKSWLWANSVDDDVLLGCLDKLYGSIDSNYLKRARSIHHQRKAAAHVSEIVNDVHTVDAFLKEITGIAEKIQKCHEEYLDLIETEKIPDLIQELRLSSTDLEYLITSLINTFEKSGSFEGSTAIRERIIQMKKMINKSHVDSILNAVQNNSQAGMYHQILQASGASHFIRQLYEIYTEPTDSWKKFAEYLVKELTSKNAEDKLKDYNWLFTVFGMKTYSLQSSRPVEEIDLDDIPF